MYLPSTSRLLSIMRSLPIFVFLAVGILSQEACRPTKTAYFENIPDTTFKSVTDGGEVVLRKNDILSITISSLNAEASAMFNRGISTDASANTSIVNTKDLTNGYLIGNDGFIQMPVLGDVKAEGFTRKELAKSIKELILQKKLLVDPTVEVRLLNYEVTVVGEVQKPTVINVSNEKISLLKALGLAGDLTIYGRRDNVLLIREENGQKKTRHIDLNSKDFITSPYYYLQPNDVVYVEPNKAKATTATLSKQVLPIVLSGLSLLVLIITRLNL